MRRYARWIVALVCAAAVVSGCSQQTKVEEVPGTAVSAYSDPFTVADLPAKNGPSGVRSGVTESSASVRYTDDGSVDRLMGTAIADIEKYWAATYPTVFKKPFSSDVSMMSWNSRDPGQSAPQFCRESTRDYVNAAYCGTDDIIGWDRGVLIPAYRQAFSDMGVIGVMAHEYGHRVQRMAGIVKEQRRVVGEQQADCFSGAYLHWVAAGNSKVFQVSTSDGLNTALAGVIASRDSRRTDNEHGSAFDRVRAFQRGFSGGPVACSQIDNGWISKQRANMPPPYNVAGQIDTTNYSDQELSDVIGSLESYFKLPAGAKPKVTTTGVDTSCKSTRTTAPVLYCPDTNTVSIDSTRLASLGQSGYSGASGLPTLISGNFSAYSLVASRYALAVLRARGQVLDQPVTAARVACITGQWAKGSRTSGGFTMRGGDLDEAVSGLLTNGLAASDVQSRSLPSGFARVDAFTAGYTGSDATCNRYNA